MFHAVFNANEAVLLTVTILKPKSRELFLRCWTCVLVQMTELFPFSYSCDFKTGLSRLVFICKQYPEEGCCLIKKGMQEIF